MRNPHVAVSKLPWAQTVGPAIRDLLDGFIHSHPQLLKLVDAAISTQDPEARASLLKDFAFPDHLILNCRHQVLRLLGCSSLSSTTTGLCPLVHEYYSKATQDPDQILATWLREGAPIGILNDVTHTGVFPLSDPKTLADPDALGTDPEGWRNYLSAEDNAEKVLEIL